MPGGPSKSSTRPCVQVAKTSAIVCAHPDKLDSLAMKRETCAVVGESLAMGNRVTGNG